MTLDDTTLLTRYKDGAYFGETLKGCVRATYLRGQAVFADGKVVAAPSGKLVTPRKDILLMPDFTALGQTRTRLTPSHALIAPDGHVRTQLPGWTKTAVVVLISAQLGARFTQYLAYLEAGGEAALQPSTSGLSLSCRGR